MDRAENKVEDMLVEKASEAIANEIYKSMSDAFDRMLADAAIQDSSYQANYSDSVALKYGNLADSWMARMNEAADIPPSYHLDHKLFVTMTSGKDIQESIMYFSSDQSIFAMEQDEDGETRLVLIDLDNDVTVLYMEEDGKKSAQAIPNMMGIGLAMAVASQDTVHSSWTIKPTGKSKQVAGYTTKEYLATDGTQETYTYVTDELDISWKNAFGGILSKFSGSQYGDSLEKHPDGFMLESRSTEIKKGKSKESYTWVTDKVVIEPFEINNSEYEFGRLANSQ